MHDKIVKMVNDKVVTIEGIAYILGITRPTVKVRLNKNNWKKSEIETLQNYFNE